MARHKDLDSFEKALRDKIRKKIPNIVAETATEYYKERFRTKEWNGKPWVQTKNVIKRGSLLVRSSKLVNSIRPSLVTHERVRISAGSPKVPYAKVHNEGGTVHPRVTAKMKKWAWANYYKHAKKGTRTTKSTGATYSSYSPGKSQKVNFFRNLALTKKTKLTVKIPQRQFMGHTRELNNRIETRIKGLLNDV